MSNACVHHMYSFEGVQHGLQMSNYVMTDENEELHEAITFPNSIQHKSSAIMP